MNSLKVTQDQYGALLIPLVNAKLPPDLRLILSRKFEGRVWNIKEMLETLKTEIEAKERTESSSSQPRKDGFNKHNQEKFFSAHSLTSSQEKHPKRPCVFCNLSNHSPAQCLKVSDPLQRKNHLRSSGRCFICFSQEHLASQCVSKYLCRKCEGKHHISICTFEKKQDHTSTNFSSNKNNVLLQTAFVEVKNLEHSKKDNVHILLDSGSQRTYISERLRKKLGLRTIRKETLKIKVFGTNTY